MRDVEFQLFSGSEHDAPRKLLDQLIDDVHLSKAYLYRAEAIFSERAIDLGYRMDLSMTNLVNDITRPVRYKLIIEANLALRAGLRSYVTHCDPDLINLYPARELVLVGGDESEFEYWIQRWEAAGGRQTAGRLIAPIYDDIWSRISIYGFPFPPFDIPIIHGGVQDVRRDLAERMGIEIESAIVKPLFDGSGRIPLFWFDEVPAKINEHSLAMLSRHLADEARCLLVGDEET